MKKKIILSIAFIFSLLPMLLNQYGGAKGVQEISVLLFIVGIWLPFKNIKVNKALSILGVIGIVVSEIYQFLTWHIQNITGEISIQNSINFAFPEFYIGLVISLIMVIAYFVIDKIVKE